MRKKKKRLVAFKRGTVVVFDPGSFNKDWWGKQSEEDLLKWYGALGYGREGLKHFVFLCEIRNAPGHCVLVSLDDQSIETMRHTENFREVGEEEF